MASLSAVINSSASLFPLWLGMTGRKDARTPKKPLVII